MTDNPKDLIGDTKPSLRAVPMIAVYEMGKAMLDGMRKYGLFNWRENAVRSDVYIDAAQRHINAWNDGENVASDSGVHHLAHAMACMAIIIDAEHAGKLMDTRTKFGGLLGKYLADNTVGAGMGTLPIKRVGGPYVRPRGRWVEGANDA